MRSRFPARQSRRWLQRPPQSVESCRDCPDPAARRARQSTVQRIVEQIVPVPARRLNQGGDGLRCLGGERRIEQIAGHGQNFHRSRHADLFQHALRPLRHKDARNMQTGAHSFAQQIGALDAGQFCRCARDERTRGAVPSSGYSAYSVQCEQASCEDCGNLLADSMPFRCAATGCYGRRVNLHATAGAVIVSVIVASAIREPR